VNKQGIYTISAQRNAVCALCNEINSSVSKYKLRENNQKGSEVIAKPPILKKRRNCIVQPFSSGFTHRRMLGASRPIHHLLCTDE